MYHIITYTPQKMFDTQRTFFVLSKGANAGRPSYEPNVNSFAVICLSEQIREYLFYLVYASWKTNYFKRELIGSVIPFIPITVIKKTLQQAIYQILQIESYIQYLSLLHNTEQKLNTQLQLTLELKQSLSYKLLERANNNQRVAKPHEV